MPTTINDLDKMISRISFRDRAMICERLSRLRLGVDQPKPFTEIDGEREAYNYELELLAFRSTIVGETATAYYTEDRWFGNCIKLIREQEYLSTLIHQLGSERVMAAIGFMQFAGQQSYSFLLYRYDFFYNFTNQNIDMKSVFMNKFHISYSDFELFIYISQLWAVLDKHVNFSFFVTMFTEPMRKVLENISITRNELVRDYQSLSSQDDLLSFLDLNMLIQTPIIYDNEAVFCLYAPYIPYACTQSLMFKLTENDDSLRSSIGKHVYESYIIDICTKSHVTNLFTIHPEFRYTRQKILSPDIILESVDQMVFIEAKFVNQGLRLRKFDQAGIDAAEDKLINGVIQLYRSIINQRIGRMDRQIPGASSKTTYGLLITYEEFYLTKANVYSKAAIELSSNGHQVSEEALKNLIRITSLSSFESILYHSAEDIFVYCRNMFSDTTTWDDRFYRPFKFADKSMMPLIDNQFTAKRKLHKRSLSYALNEMP